MDLLPARTEGGGTALRGVGVYLAFVSAGFVIGNFLSGFAVDWLDYQAAFWLTGLFSVAVAAAIAARTGQARGYFLLGIAGSFLYGGVFAVTLLIRRPLVGVLWEFVDPAPLPDSPEAVEVNDASCAILARAAGRVSTALATAQILKRQACYRPVTDDGLPLIGRVPRVTGAYVATGHGPWGMLNAPATGLALAELITQGVASTVDLRPFDPARL